MNLTPHPRFRGVIRVLDAANPAIVLASIAGLILEFTPLKPWVKNFNTATDIVFVFDFLLRFLAFPKRAYFFKHYGWVDLLAAIPGLLILLEQVPSLLAVFKFLRIGRFFKIIRLLRFLRIFAFLRRMKDDSPWVQDRIMKIGVVVVLVGVFTIGVAEFFVERQFEHQTKEKLEMYEKLTGSFSLAVQVLTPRSVVAWQQGEWYTRGLDETLSPTEYKHLGHHEDFLIIHLDGNRSVILYDKTFLQDRNNVALTLMLSIIATLLLLLFYMGAVLAKDMSHVTLITDSVEAGDYTLLLEEGHLIDPAGQFEAEPGEMELTHLVKVMNRLVKEKNLQDDGMEPAAVEPVLDMPPDFSLPGEGSTAVAAAPVDTVAIQQAFEESLERFKETFRDELLSEMRGQSRDTAVEAVKISAKSIVEYIKKQG